MSRRFCTRGILPGKLDRRLVIPEVSAMLCPTYRSHPDRSNHPQALIKLPPKDVPSTGPRFTSSSAPSPSMTLSLSPSARLSSTHWTFPIVEDERK